MAVLSQLATLGCGVRHSGDTVPIGTLLSNQTALEEQAYRQPEGDKTPDSLTWTAFCAVYRLTASVYLYRALSGLDADYLLVQKAVAACMEVVGGPDPTDKLHHCILFRC